ncbi:MAG: transglutaminase-like domain-containing protein [Hadesarchaea archaeon]|nr:transglutaminase-like domain-containing protein [Hadesarchaea archaeon]
MTGKKWLPAVLALALVPAIIVGTYVLLQSIFAQPTMQEMVPPALAAFFDTFDQDNSKGINFAESQAFFNWCKANIPYRYDDENAANPVPGSPVGDGRPGKEYWQKPIETYNERAGDCEDMAILSAAFYRYYNIMAYIATVNAEGAEVDHAVCIVKIGATPQEAAEYLGGLVYYELEGSYYMLVDVAYSNQFGLAGSNPGEASQLLEQGKFVIQDRITLEAAYMMSEM